MKFLLDLLLRRENSLRGATGILAFTLLFSNILGVVRDHFLAQKIPADTLDIYYTAFRWPDLLFNIIILGAVSSAFIPVFSGALESNKQRAIAVANTLIVTLIGILIAISLLFILIMPFLINILAPGFPEEKLALTIYTARLLLLSPIFFCFSYVFSGILQSWQRFLIPSLSPLVYNASIIVATIIGADQWGIIGVAWGVVIGAFLHGIIQIPSLYIFGWKPLIFVSLRDSLFRKVFRLMIPRAIGLGANQLLLLVYTSIASTISAGAIALYNLADNIQTTPTVIFANSVAGALFPVLSKIHAQGDQKTFSRYLERSVVTVLFFLIPMACGIILLRSQIVRLILGSGFFGWEETVRTATSLGGFAIGIPSAGLMPLFARAFYARHNTVTPTFIMTLGSGVAIAVAYFFGRHFDVAGLAVAFSIGNIVSALIFYITIQRIVPLDQSIFIKSLAQISIGSLVMSMAVQVVKNITGSYWPLTTGLAVLHQLIVAVVVGAVIYFGVMKIVKFDFVWLKKQ